MSHPIPLRLREIPEWGADLAPGDCWFAVAVGTKWCMFTDPERGPIVGARVAPEHQSKRPVVVVLPNGVAWCVHAGTSGGSGWQVTGEPPRLTVTPSIDMKGGGRDAWHGWIRDGRLVTC